MKMDRRVVLGVLLAGLLFLTGFLLRDLFQANLVQPIALILWIGNRLVDSIDQVTYWAGLILVLVVITLLRYLRQPDIREVERSEAISGTLYSIRHWRTLILLTSGESDRLNFLKHSLQTLLRDLYASKEPSEVPWKAYQELEQGGIRLPASIRKFLMLDPPADDHPTQEQRLRRLVRSPLDWSRRHGKQNEDEYYQSIEEVIAFMEKELENEDDA